MDRFDFSEWSGNRRTMAEECAAEIYSGNCTAAILTVGGEIVGIAALKNRGKTVEIVGLATKRAGYGRQLIDKIRDLGRIRVWSTEDARGFYRKVGLTEHGRRYFTD